MFEAVVNRQFKTYFSGLSGSVNMGAITVLRRIFNVHKIDGYVLIDNIENQVVLMKKKEFDSLCEYIKVDLERTSAIPRATIEKRGSVKVINMGAGGYLPYRMVSFREYSNYLNTTYYTKIQEYHYMTLRYMNFSHYEVIFKAMNSEMKSYISEMYSKYGEKLNKLMSNRGYNAEEYEVLLLALANVGVGELDLEGFTELCKVKELGARGLRTRLGILMSKYQMKGNKNENTLNKCDSNKETEQVYSSFNPMWFLEVFKNVQLFKIVRNISDENIDFLFNYKGIWYPLNICNIYKNKNYGDCTRLLEGNTKLSGVIFSHNELKNLSFNELNVRLIANCEKLCQKELEYDNNINLDEIENWYKIYISKYYKNVSINENDVIITFDMRRYNKENFCIVIKNEKSEKENVLKIYDDCNNNIELFSYIIDTNVLPRDVRRWSVKLEQKIRKIQNKVIESKKEEKALEEKGSNNLQKMRATNEIRIKTIENEMNVIYTKIKELENYLPLKEYGEYYIDNLADVEGVIVQSIDEFDYDYPSAIFSYSDDYHEENKWVSFFILFLTYDRYNDSYLFGLSSFDKDYDPILYSTEDRYLTTKQIEEMLSKFIEEYGIGGMFEEEAKELYSWYKPYNIKEKISELEELYEQKRKELERLIQRNDNYLNSSGRIKNKMEKNKTIEEAKDALKDLYKLFHSI